MSDRNLTIVTGAAGLVGRAVCAELYAQNFNVLPVVRKSSDKLYQNQLVMDLSKDKDFFMKVDGKVSGVIHLAAAVPHSASYPDTEGSANVTRKIDNNILSAVNEWDCPVVYMSTCGLYDRYSPVIKHESDVEGIKIEGSYFSAKYDGEAKFIANSEAVILRLAAPIGVGLKAGLVVSRFMELARKNQVLQIWGTGLREQNFIDVRDVVNIAIKAMKNPHKGIFNVANKQPTTMRDLAQNIIDVVGSGSLKLPNIPDPRDGETARYSISMAQKIYGWMPQFSLEDALLSIKNTEFEH